MQYIEIGKIVNTHGIRGEVKIYTYTDNIDNLKKLKKVYLVMKDGSLKETKVQSSKIQKAMLLVKLEGIDTIEAAEALRETIVKRERKNNELGENEFFIADLIGLEVYEDNGKYLGILDDVLKPGANDVYVVKLEDKSELLLPVIDQVVKSIDLENKKIVVHVMEGLR